MLLSGIERQVFVTKVLDDIDVMVWVKDSSNNLIYINKYALNKLFDCDTISDIAKEKCPLSCEAQNICFKEEQVLENIEVNGKNIWLSCKKLPINGDGGMMVFAEDVTDKITKENIMLEKLNERIDGWKQKRKISADKSREEMKDINNILNEIKEKRSKQS